MPAAERKATFWEQVAGLPANFWFANLMEMFERLAFFGSRAIAPLYLVAESNRNGLGLSYTDKGWIYFWWALIQCIVPMVSGGYTERYGYRRSLAVAFIINAAGYSSMALSKPITDYIVTAGWAGPGVGFWVFLAAACMVALGTAIFKPPVHGTIARTTTEESSSLGWGVFYWAVNIGGALAPMAAAELRGEINWHYVFYGAAIVTLCNFLPCFLLYREPEKVPRPAGEKQKGPFGVFFSSIATIFKDLRLVVFLLIFSCFWLMFMQLWDLLPNFIEEWVDTSDVAGVFGWVSSNWVLQNGQTKPEIMINIDAWAIIVLVLVISWIVRKMHKVAAMIVGMVISLVGFVGAGMTQIGVICAIMIFVFSIGEMACSPTFSAYVGLIAPKDKKALYMGYSNIPFAIGWAMGSLVGGLFYDAFGAKATLAWKALASDIALVARAVPGVDFSDSLEKLPPLLGIEREQAFERAQAELGLPVEETGSLLRDAFRFDQGQVANLALLYLADQTDTQKGLAKGMLSAIERLAKEVQQSAQQLTKRASAKPPTVPSAQPAAPTTNPTPPEEETPWLKSPVVGEIEFKVARIRLLLQMLAELKEGKGKVEASALAPFIDLVPDLVGKTRGNAFGDVRDKVVNKDLSKEQKKSDGEVIALLWERFGDDPGVLDNLALEYLAQGTVRLEQAVIGAGLEQASGKSVQRCKELEQRLGIGRGKATAGLEVAMGRSPAELESALAHVEVSSGREVDRLWVYLMDNKRIRTNAVTQKKWEHNLPLLRAIVEGDGNLETLVRKGLRPGLLRRLFTSGGDEQADTGIDYGKLAGNQDLLQKVVAGKDWRTSPELVPQVLGINTYEARALARGDFEAAKQALWRTYHPFLVWVYLGVFGVAGTVGMIWFYLATRHQRVVADEQPVAGASGA